MSRPLLRPRLDERYAPLSTGMGPTGARHPSYSHYAYLGATDRKNGAVTVWCHQCDFTGRYPTRDHAKQVADQHMVRTHVSGWRVCGNAWCHADAALRRMAARPN